MTIPLDFQIKRLGVPVAKGINWKRTTVASREGGFDGGLYQMGEETKKGNK